MKKKNQKSFSPFSCIVLFILLLFFSILYYNGMLKEDLIILRFEVANVEQNSDEEFLIKDGKLVEIIIMNNINYDYRIKSFKINEKNFIVEEKLIDKDEGAYYSQKNEKYETIIVKYRINDNEEKLVLSEIYFSETKSVFSRNYLLDNENNKEIKIRIIENGDLE